ncbi:MAG: NUDIX domain-containing protein [Trueperaceae bacterium]
MPPTDAAPARPRPTVRVLLLDAADRVLLQSAVDPEVRRPGAPATDAPAWFPPGGGLEPGEDPAAGLARELREETGFVDVAWGAWTWRRVVELQLRGEVRRFEEAYRLARVAALRPTPRPTAFEPWEARTFRGFRWWTLPELAQTSERVFPPRLAERLAALLADGPPPAPIDVSADG